MHHVLDVVLVGDEVDAEQAGVAVGGVEGLEALAQTQLRRQTRQTAAQVLWNQDTHKQRSQIKQGLKMKHRGDSNQSPGPAPLTEALPLTHTLPQRGQKLTQGLQTRKNVHTRTHTQELTSTQM